MLTKTQVTERLRKMLEHDTSAGVARATGISRNTVLQLAAGAGAKEGTVFLASWKLEQLDAAERAARSAT